MATAFNHQQQMNPRILTNICAALLPLIAMLLPMTAATARDLPDERPSAQTDGIFSNPLNWLANSEKIALDSLSLADEALNERVIVGGDTVSIILPQKNYGRFDRGLFNYMFVPKGQWSFGMQASYGEFNTNDIQLLSILKDFNIGVKAYSLQPSIAYFFKSNQSVGINFNFTRMYVDLDGMSFDISDDMNFNLSDVSYYSQNFSAAIAYRNYVGLGRAGRFAVFNEVELAFGGGASRFKRQFDGAPRDTRTNSTTCALNFSPGLTVFIMDHVSFNVSFGVFGLRLHHERQWTDGEFDGSRFSSGANFRFNIFNINFGMAVFI